MKNMKKIVSVLLTLTILIACLTAMTVSVSAASDPDIQANAVLLMENTTGTELYAKNSDARIYPASTTKIMTALLVIEAIENGTFGENDMVTLSDGIYEGCEGGSTADLKSGEEISVGDLLRCALIASANEACNALAENLSGTTGAFVTKMNAKAAELGCTGTHFANCHGMPDDNHYTTARDLYYIFREAYSHDLFKTIIKTGSYTVPATELSDSRTLTSTNRLINSDSTDYNKYCLGGKTGYTDSAGYCLVSAANDGVMDLTAVVMGCASVTLEDNTTQVQSFTETNRLYSWGFSSFSYRTVLSTGDLIGEVPVAMGSGADSVILRPENSVVIFLDNDIDVTKFEKTIHITSEENGESLTAPIDAGQELGELHLKYNGKDYGSVKLVASTSVPLSKIEFMRNQISDTLGTKAVKLIIFLVILLFVLYAVGVIFYNFYRRKKRRTQRSSPRRPAVKIGSAPNPGHENFDEIESAVDNAASSAASKADWNTQWDQDAWK